MNIEEKIIDYLYGTPSPEEVQEMESLIKTDEQIKRVFEEMTQLKQGITELPRMTPDVNWVNEFAQKIERTSPVSQEQTRVIPMSFYAKVAAAAAVVLIVGLTVVNWNQRQVIQHVDQEIVALHQMMERSLQEPSVSARIKAVNFSEQAQQKDQQVMALLSKVLHEDPSAHVRLAASEALNKWIHEENVRESLIYALKKEKDPSVQISIITSLSSSLDEGVKSHLEDLIKDENTPEFVKEEAEIGKFRMDNNLKIY